MTMQHTLTFNKNNKEIHFTHRHNELRVVIKDVVDTDTKTAIARYTSQELTILKNDEFGEIVHTQTSEMQHAHIVLNTLFSHKMQYLILESAGSSLNLYFDKNEWKEIVDFI